MKRLLFDQNLSPRLPTLLADKFPGSQHVVQIGLDLASDRVVRDYAREHDFVIVTKDADFSELNVIFGFPPKVIWIRRGNCSTKDIEELLREQYESVEMLSNDEHTGILTLY